MRLGAKTDGALLQRALEGAPVPAGDLADLADLGDRADLGALVALAREVESVADPALAPRAAFVADLRLRLLDEPLAAAPGERPDGAPTVVRFGRRARSLVAAAAVVIALAGVLGALSRSALPGDRLYPVKQLLGRVGLELQREPFGRGLAHLDQAREHVGDAERLLARSHADGESSDGVASEAAQPPASGSGRDPGLESGLDPGLDLELASALDAATESSTDGQAALLEAYRSLRQADPLLALNEYYAGIVPTVDGLATVPLPSAATTAWQRLRDVLEQGRDATLRELAACSSCGDASAQARSLLSDLAGDAVSGPTSPSTSSPPSPTRRPSSTTAGTNGSTGPSGTRATGDPSTGSSPSSPGRSASSPADRTGGSSDADGSAPSAPVRLPTLGVTSSAISAGGGGVSLPAPLPTVSLPGAAVDTSAATLGGGAVTLPGATLSVPTVSVPLP
jgi:hypothetical protein